MNLFERIEKENLKCLLVSPHPDDETIGCGGLLVKYGKYFDCVCVGSSGVPSRDYKITAEERNKMRHEEWAKVISIYNVKSQKIYSTYGNVYPFIDKLNEYKPIIRKELSCDRYDYIFVPNFDETSPEHIWVTYKFLPYLLHKQRNRKLKIVMYEVWGLNGIVTDFLDISDIIEKKIDILRMYESQLTYVDFDNRVKALNYYRGLMAGEKTYAEAYRCLSARQFKYELRRRKYFTVDGQKKMIKEMLKKVIPSSMKGYIRKKWNSIKYNKLANTRNTDVEKRIQHKLATGEKINVCFFESRAQIWFYDELYNLFNNDKRFNVNAIIIPFTANGKDGIISNMNQLYELLEKKGISSVKTYNKKTGKYLDVKKEYAPDIIFFTENWHGLCDIPEFYMERFDSSWNYFCFYGIHAVINPGIFNMEPNYLAKADFIPSSKLLKDARKSRGDSARNCFVSGHPKLDIFFNTNYVPTDPWKKQRKHKKRIIWAPHFSFGDNAENPLYVVGSFYEISDYMLEIAEYYKDSVQFCFKPHPVLRTKLLAHWSKAKIDEYYKKWDDLSNCQFENGNYIDLFLTSDAMIFDSISFIVEYLCTLKPSLYTVCKDAKLSFNELGMSAYKQIYHTSDIKKDIKKFIEDVVLEENDPMLEQRKAFVEKEISPKNNISASKNMYDKVIQDLGL